MANDQEPPYDPYIPNGQAGGQGGNSRTQALQAVSSNRFRDFVGQTSASAQEGFTSLERWRPGKRLPSAQSLG
jgi:hypothetical protein